MNKKFNNTKSKKAAMSHSPLAVNSPIRFKQFARKAYSVFNSLHKTINIGVVVGSVLTAMIIPSAKGQEIPARQAVADHEHELEEITVTASRIELPVNQTARLVTVISREQISQSPAQSIQDALIEAANVDVVQRGNHGVQADISIRGGTFDQNAIILNGINITNAHTGHYNFDIPINLSDIERIEIIHGPAALTCGAGTFTGAINIITDKTTNRPLYIKAKGGMYGLAGGEIRGSQRTGALTHTLSLGYDRSDGYIHNTDYGIGNALSQTRLQLPKGGKLDLQLGFNAKEYGANAFYSPRFPDQYERTSALLATLKAEIPLHTFKVVPIIYWTRHHDRFELTKGREAGRNHHRNDALGANLVLSRKSIIGNTALALEYRRETIHSNVLGKPMIAPQGHYTRYDKRSNASAALEHTLALRRWTLSAGAMLYHTSMTSGAYKLYPTAALSYRPIDPIKLSASWSKSTRLPTFTDLYYTTATHDGNTQLRPETSESFDAGIHYSSGNIAASATAFHLRSADIIDWVKTTPQDAKWASWNHTSIRSSGLELSLSCRPISNVRLTINYAHLNQTADTHGMISAYALTRLRDKLTAQIAHPIYKKFTARWHFKYQKRMGSYEKYEDLVKIADLPYPPFTTLDLTLNYRLPAVNLSLNITNIYNTSYFDLGNIPQPGTWAILAAEYIF
ncbi:MAG: TonB-dependent receptor [Tannerellaceae bacterium]|jgi:iron complex outermembrane receptor protein|nr:TonB-dependent receptor [Tannerellaceae bacterium]